MEKEKQKFIRKITLFLITFLIIFLLLNQFYINNIIEKRLIYQKEKEWQGQLKTMGDKHLDYAFFGDSHVRSAMNPAYIPNSFNFANIGEDYIETYFQIKKLLEKDGAEIDNFVLQLDPITFSNKLRVNGTLLQELRFYSRLMSYEELSKLRNEGKVATYIKTKFPVLGGGEYIIWYLLEGRKIILTQEKGWTNSTRNFDLTDKTDLSMSGEFNFDPDTINKKSLDYLIKIIELAEEKNINLIFVKYPHTREYDQELEKRNISRENYYEKVFTTINKTTTNYKLLDYYSEFFDSPELFSDGSHLNHIGSTIISKRVLEEARSISDSEESIDEEKSNEISKVIYLSNSEKTINNLIMLN